MKPMLQRLIATFLAPDLDIRVRLFNLLAMVGTANSLLMVICSLFIADGLLLAGFNLLVAGLSFGLLYYSYRTGRYQQCYLITILAIFFAAFTFLFLAGGGYRSGFPAFFIFGIVFTVFMLDGWRMLVVTALELLFYIGLCLYSYYVPEQVVWLGSDGEVVADVILGFTAVSLALGLTMHFSFRIYKRQQLLLEQTRDEAIRANQAKSIFLANMSHEIRTPINIMLAMNEMVLREIPSDVICGYISRSQDAGHMLLALINDVLDVAKIEAGKMELLEEAYSTSDLVRYLEQLGRELSEKKGLSFTAETAGLPAMLWGDCLHIRQIAANLLHNAVKYTEAGSVKLTVTGRDAPDGDGILLTIAVADTGIGIRPEDKDVLFEAFTRCRTSRNHKIEGTGLGLAIARNLVTLMGGRLSVESEYGAGSMFTAEIPQHCVENAADVPGAAVTLAEQSFIAPHGRILVVDDNAGNLAVVKLLLARTLLQIDTAQSVQECLEQAGKNQYHAILLDYMMPQMDGIQALYRLRQMHCDIPVIALTADVTAGTRQKLLDAGFADYLAKPVSWIKLEQSVLACLPEQLVQRTAIGAGRAGDETAQLQLQLQQYDISLESGLRFVNRDLSQYKLIAGIFLVHTRQTPELMTEFVWQNDLRALSHVAHSLKTLARLVGAEALFGLARRIEEKCADGEGEYIRSALPLFLYELETTRRGLDRLIRQDQATPAEAAATVPSEESSAMLAARAEMSIANYHCAESRQALALLLPLERDAVRRRLLEQALAAVEELNFEEAEALFAQFREGGGSLESEK